MNDINKLVQEIIEQDTVAGQNSALTENEYNK